ncbi:hypothetical protein BUQ74_04330 [Leptospira weilii serovar Heyan]|nr:YceK/YidQ family lipoprotein [Leptospira weilii]OMI18617.1 hypothetical protein BUQ74_04330 [Leptospira weilii serovar Heyan]QDK24677.1 YceK/YidQ family lipoprotein [Leptospira weilii]QDK28624.1 YceK/YidQ family lipoprotein [Leptospira weilii]
MKLNFLISILLVVLLGCSSIQEHGAETNNWGHPYIGMQISITSFPCLVELSSILYYIPVPFIILNVPLSFIVDTILLPGDLMIKPEKKRPTMEDRYCDAP